MKNIIYVFMVLIMLLLSGCVDNKKADTTQTASVSASVNTQQSQYTTPPEFHEHPDAAKIEYPDVTFYYDNDKDIFSYNPKTQERQKIIAGSSPLLSHDKTMFAYGVEGAQATASYSVMDIYLYDIKTKKAKFIFANDPNFFPWMYYQTKWSANDRYLALQQDDEAAICPVKVYDVIQDKIIQKFVSYDDYLWISNKEILINDLEADIKPTRSTSTGSPHGIAVINLETGEKKILKQATPTEDYSFMVDDEKQIIMTKTVWELEEKDKKAYLGNITSVTYYVIDKDGKILKETTDPYPKSRSNYDKLQAQIQGLLSSQSMSYKYAIPYYLDNSWVVLSLRNDYQHNAEFFIMDKTNPHSLRKIGDGNSITW